jgi:hypothetical protein
MNRPKIPNVVGRTQEIKSQRLASTVTIGLVTSSHLLLLLPRQLQGADIKRLVNCGPAHGVEIATSGAPSDRFAPAARRLRRRREQPCIRRWVSVSVVGWV